MHNTEQKKKDYGRRRYIEHRDRLLAQNRAWRAAHPSETRAYSAKYRAEHSDKLKEYRKNHRRERREYQNRRLYGLSDRDRKQLLVDQNGRCALCHRFGRDGELVTDHDHETGIVRGLLCQRCNLALGAYERLMGAVGSINLEAYLRRGKTWMR